MDFNLYEFFTCVSEAADLATPGMAGHYRRVAYLGYRLAEYLGLPVRIGINTLSAALLMDVGALSEHERLSVCDYDSIDIHRHAFRGAMLLEQSESLRPLADAVRLHHVPWDYGAGKRFMGRDVPITAHILHICGRACTLVGGGRDVLGKLSQVMDILKMQSGSLFPPNLVDALASMRGKEYIFLEMASADPLVYIETAQLFSSRRASLEECAQIAATFSQMVDFRSVYTIAHSLSVADCAHRLGEMCGLSADECRMLLISGYLHDLGKLAIPSTLLDKPATLTDEEYSVVRGHPFYTYQLLGGIKGAESIRRWASYHHERLDGSGYPFHLKGPEIPFGAKIVAAADIFAAVAEHRPYRAGMDRKQIEQTLGQMSRAGLISAQIVTLLLENINQFLLIRHNSQLAAQAAYKRLVVECMTPPKGS